MYACLYSLSAPVAALIRIAEEFTPRFEVVGPVVMLDVSGLSRLFGTPQEIGEQLRRAAAGVPVRIAVAPTQTAAVLVVLGRPGLTVVQSGDQSATLAGLSVTVLGEFERVSAFARAPLTELRRDRSISAGAVPGERQRDVVAAASGRERRPVTPAAPAAPGSAPVAPVAPGLVGEMFDVLPYFQSSLDRTSDAAAAPHRAVPSAGGWSHPRDSHAAAHARRPRRPVTTPGRVEHAHAAAGPPLDGAASGGRASQPVHGRAKAHAAAVERLQDTLRRWGVRTLAQLAALPPGDVYERLGARGVLWQRLARGDDTSPLVPWVPEEPFESSLDLEWPIEGLEPLSFVLGRLFEPLAERLERAGRGAAILHTHLRLVDKTVHARTLQLPAPMRDPKTLRTLVLLDLESHPPSAAIDRVRVLTEPTPARVTQWALFERAQPSPEQVSTLLARLSALMGDTHVGSPQLVDSWKPGAFEMTTFESTPVAPEHPSTCAPVAPEHPSTRGTRAPSTALRRFRLPIPARVQMHDGRPIRVLTDRRGVSGGPVVQSAGPWRTSGEWWNDGHHARAWDRDEWDIALGDGTVYRIFVERNIGQWFLEGVVD